MAVWIANRLENILSNSNKEYKVFFPEKEMLEFAESVLDKVDQYFVGHFHQSREIKLEPRSGILRVVPDWLSQRKIVKIDENGIMEIISC